MIRPKTQEIQNRTVKEFVTDIHNEQYELLRKNTSKRDEHQGSMILSPVPTSLCKFLYLNSTILNKCVRAIAEDTILGQISCDDETVSRFWKNNQKQLYYLMKDYILYGYSVGELLFHTEPVRDDNGDYVYDNGEVRTYEKLITIRQAPAYSFKLLEIDGSTYAEQEINGETTLYNINGEIYNPNTRRKTNGTVLWIGGDEMYTWYSIPQWYASRTQLLMNITLTDLDINTFQKGNLMSGVFAVTGPRQLKIGDEPSTAEQLKEQFSEVGTGLAVSYIENSNKDIPINMDYINLTSNNYDYIQQRYSDNEQSVLEAFFIPKERLLNNDTKESMNSNKSEQIWNTYIRSLGNIQSIILDYCNKINSYYLKKDYSISISLPTFEDNTQITIQNVTSLMQLGLMSQAEAVEYLNNNMDIELEAPSGGFSTMKSPLNLTSGGNDGSAE